MISCDPDVADELVITVAADDEVVAGVAEDPVGDVIAGDLVGVLGAVDVLDVYHRVLGAPAVVQDLRAEGGAEIDVDAGNAS